MRDVAGTAWVYVPAGPHVYERVRVEVERVGTEGARLSRGLAAGTQVVSVGASELFGAEFGTGK